MIPTFGGFSCPGSSVLYETCTATQNCSSIFIFNVKGLLKKNISFYLVDGQWGPWQPWSACTATCGKSSTKYTTRACDSPPPLYGI
jgi:hypothetical protein